MSDLKQAARLALDALEEVFDRGQCELTYLQGKRAIAALRAALAQQAEPVISKDAYDGAREDLAIWKTRALKAEELNRKFVASVNSQTFMGEPVDKLTITAPEVDKEQAEPVAEPVNAAVLESLKAIVEFADAPAEGKRPDVFFMRINNARAAIARAEQVEPVAWVGLTSEDMDELAPYGQYAYDVALLVEERLKEKNAQQAEPVVEHRTHPTNIYDFAGWLTTRPGLLKVGSSYDVNPMVDAIREYLHKFPDRFASPVHAEPVACPLGIHPIHTKYCSAQTCDACKAQKAEPVGQVVLIDGHADNCRANRMATLLKDLPTGTLLYAGPPAQQAAPVVKREPLTKAELLNLLIPIDPENVKRLPHGFYLFARAIEKAHGIGEEE